MPTKKGKGVRRDFQQELHQDQGEGNAWQDFSAMREKENKKEVRDHGENSGNIKLMFANGFW